MNPHRTVAVFGATGSVGGQVVAQLATTGVAVRAVGRNAAALGELSRRHGAEPFVADLAAVGVRMLLEDGHHSASYHLTGPEALTQVEQVAAIGDALGRPLRFVDVGEQDAPALLAPAPVADARAVVAAQLAMAEHPEPVTAEVEHLLGRPARSYRQWARDHVEDFR